MHNDLESINDQLAEPGQPIDHCTPVLGGRLAVKPGHDCIFKFRLSGDLLAAAHLQAHAEGIKISEFVRRSLRRDLNGGASA